MTTPTRISVFARRTAARKVALDFMPAEQSAEQTVLNAARCVITMITQRNEAQLEAHVGSEELLLVTKGAAAAAESFRFFAEAHRGLIKIPEQNDMPADFGPTCGPNTGLLADEDGLDRQVA